MEKAQGRAGRRALAALLAAVLLMPALPAGAAAPSRARSGELGPLEHYNALLFGHFESVHGYMEGAMAVAGVAELGSSSGSYEAGLAAARPVVGSYENPRGYPTMLLGEAPVVGMPGYSNCTVYGGPVALGSHALEDYQKGGQTLNIRHQAGLFPVESARVEAYFQDAYSAVVHTGRVLEYAYSPQRQAAATLGMRDLTSWSAPPGLFDDLTRYRPDNLETGGMRVLLLIVEDEEHLEVNSPRISAGMADYDLVVLHFPNASSVRFTGGALQIGQQALNPTAGAGAADNRTLGEWAGRLVWHFPAADAVQIAGHGVVGSLIAPRAYVEGSGGVIDGMLIADSLLEAGGMHLNAFPLDGRIFDWTNKDGEHPLTGSVRVIKYDSSLGANSFQGNLLLEGAVFQLYRLGGLGTYQLVSDQRYETGVDGSFLIENLPEGQYALMEIQAPYGYYLSGELHPFAIDPGHGVERPVVLGIPNRLIKLPVQVRKVDAQTRQGLAGARFLLYETTGSQVEIAGDLVSRADGLLNLPDMEYGRYRLVEIAPPDGYESRFDQYLDVILEGDAQGNASVHYQTPGGELISYNPYQEIRLPNSPSQDSGKRLVVSKLDQDDPDTPLDGAIFSLELWEPGAGWRMLYPRLETDRYGLLEVAGLGDGGYRLTELEPSVGYRTMEDVYEFTLNRSDTAVIEVYNRAVGRITVEKVDADTREGLAGAEFTLYYDRGGDGRAAVGQLEEVASGETGEGGQLHFEHLKPGRYYVVQTKAPEGYRPLESPELAGSAVVSYILDANGDKVPYPEEVEMEVLALPDMATATVHKVDSAVYRSEDYDPAGGHGLPGARFRLESYDEEAHGWTTLQEEIRVERADGRVTIGELPPGRYKLVELSPPSGYVMDTEYGLNQVIFAVQSGDGVLDEEIVVENRRVGSAVSSGVTGQRVSGGWEELPRWEIEPDNPPTGTAPRGRGYWAMVLLWAGWMLWRTRKGKRR